MYDTVWFMLNENDIDNSVSFMEETSCLIRIDKDKSTNSKIIGWLNNMLVEIRGKTLYVKGSLCKWKFGNNIKTMNQKDIRQAIASLGEALHLPMEKAKVTRIDIAINFEMEYKSDIYLAKLLYLNKYHRSNIKKDTLYFKKADETLTFYDKVKQLKDNLASIHIGKDFNLLRYELRLCKLRKKFKKDIHGKDLYDFYFYRQLIKEWHKRYVAIDKCADDFNDFDFKGRKSFSNSCVLYCCSKFNMKQGIKEAFALEKITSSDKYYLIALIDKIKRLHKDNSATVPIIEELNIKVERAYRRQLLGMSIYKPDYWDFLDVG